MFKLPIFVFIATLVVGVFPVSATDTQIVAGAGPSTEITQLFFAEFSKLPAAINTRFTIMDASVKHAGGIKNSDVIKIAEMNAGLKVGLVYDVKNENHRW